MKVLLASYSNEMQARLNQGFLGSVGIESTIMPGSPSTYETSINPVTGLDNNYLLYIKDTDFLDAKQILEGK